MAFLLKTARNAPAEPVDDATGREVLQRLRHEGRKLVDVFVLGADGRVDRFQERARRRLGSNAIASRTWLCETAPAGGAEWGDGRYIPEPLDAIDALAEPPIAVILVVAGAEGVVDDVMAQLHELAPAR